MEHPLEDFFLNRAPWALATQGRFVIFKREIQGKLFEGCSLASVPCGMMADLLDLDYSSLNHVSLHGFDLDPTTLELAKSYAAEKGLLEACSFEEKYLGFRNKRVV